MPFFEVKVISSMEKIFCREKIDAAEIHSLSSGRGETVSFQIACRAENNTWITVTCESDIASLVEIRETGLVPCELPAMPDDTEILTSEAGLYPDPLYPVNGKFRVSRRNWHSLWISVKIPENFPSGSHSLKFHFQNNPQKPHDSQTEFTAETTMNLHILPYTLPVQKLICTNWFYADCIFTYYKVPCWSEEHWNLLERYFRNMAEHGINTLLTPLWTIPLDTAPEHERPTAQLLDIERINGVLKFDFARLKRWIELAEHCGIKYFEMSHAFTQWGALFTPKIIVRENEEDKKLFGWQTRADSTEYAEFLKSLMPPLLTQLRKLKLTGRCYFHISDEPEMEHMEDYRKATALFRPLVEDFPIIDALSELSFFKNGIIKRPVPNTEKLDDFMGENLEQRWVYYAGNYKHVPNRQFGMPSIRNRILGVILYLYRLDGFLHWGYNFWYTQYSLDQTIDPFKTTDAGKAFCGGGSFMVYPGKNAPLDSLHYEVFREGLQDLRALSLLESRIGYEAVSALIHENLKYKITIKKYPLESAWLIALREKVNRALVN